MTDKEKMLIEENMKVIEIRTKLLVNKYGIRLDEYDEYLQMACLVLMRYASTSTRTIFLTIVL